MTFQAATQSEADMSSFLPLIHIVSSARTFFRKLNTIGWQNRVLCQLTVGSCVKCLLLIPFSLDTYRYIGLIYLTVHIYYTSLSPMFLCTFEVFSWICSNLMFFILTCYSEETFVLFFFNSMFMFVFSYMMGIVMINCKMSYLNIGPYCFS